MSQKDKKFVDLSLEEQIRHVAACFSYQEGKGWFSNEGEFAGMSLEKVIAALIDFEDAEINAIGDCMSGYCLTQPKLSDFVRKQ